MGVWPPDFRVQSLHEEGHIAGPVLLGEEFNHAVDAALDVAHAFVLVDIVQLHLSLGIFLLALLLLLFNLHDVFLADKFLEFSVLPKAVFIKLALEDHSGVEAFIGGHKGRVDVFRDQVVRLELGHVRLLAQAHLDGLELHVVEVGLHLKVKGTLSVYYKLPYRILIAFVAGHHKQKLTEKVLL